jgi:hypothetical protein
MSAIDSLLTGLIDYAGLYPPTGLEMRVALRNYFSYLHSRHALALGRFLVDLPRVGDLKRVAGDAPRGCRIAVIATPSADWDVLWHMLDDGLAIDTVEVKVQQPAEIDSIARSIPLGLQTYFEIPVSGGSAGLFDAIEAHGARVKLRMGGLVAEAFPSVEAILKMLTALAGRKLKFKATAGLHHPIRSRHPFSYQPDSPTGMMHGFINLACAAAVLFHGGAEEDAKSLLEEQDGSDWQVSEDAIAWRSLRWSAEDLRQVREKFFMSFGSCSFTEPIDDLEKLGWL